MGIPRQGAMRDGTAALTTCAAGDDPGREGRSPQPVMQRFALLIMKFQPAPKQTAQESENHG